LPNLEITVLASFSETEGALNCQLHIFFDSWEQMFDIHGHLHLTDVYSAPPVQTLDNFTVRHKYSVILTGCKPAALQEADYSAPERSIII
jgi:hypothetical protein